MLFALCLPAHAQQPAKVPRIGFLANTKLGNPGIEPFRRGLQGLGYIEGRNIRVEYRYYETKRELIPPLVAELVQMNVDVLVVGSPPAIRAARQATKTIPIVIVTNQDPVAAGYVDSLARPGGNTTGVTNLTRELGGKRLELLKEIAPKLSRVGILWNADALESDWAQVLKNMRLKQGAKDSAGVVAHTCFKSRFRRCISRCYQSARECAHHAYAYSSQPIPKRDCWAGPKAPVTFDGRDRRICRRGWTDIVCSRRRREIQAGCLVCRQDPKGS